MTVMQLLAICFAAGVVGALAVVLFSHILFALGLSQKVGVSAPTSSKAPGFGRAGRCSLSTCSS